MKDRILRWFLPDDSDRRRANRHPLPGLVAYYWTGGAPQAYQVGDISETGLYLLTENRPLPGTGIVMTLQRTVKGAKNPEDSISVLTRVVRWGADGVGLAFVLSRFENPKGANAQAQSGTDKKALKQFLERLKLPDRK